MVAIEDLFLTPARRISRLLELPQNVLFDTYYYLHLFYSKTIGFPYCPPELIERKFSKQLQIGHIPTDELQQEELDRYRTFSRRSPAVTITLALLHWIFTGKNLIFVIGTIMLLDLSKPASNLKQVTIAPPGQPLNASNNSRAPNNHQFTKFTCMLTNCSRLTQTSQASGRSKLADQFANDLIQLPVLSICAGHLRAYLNPLVYMHLIGLIGASCLALFVFVLSSLTPASCYLFPIDVSSIMDIMFPRTSLINAHMRISLQLETLLYSQVNYCDAQSTHGAGNCAHWRPIEGFVGEWHRASERLVRFQAMSAATARSLGRLNHCKQTVVMIDETNQRRVITDQDDDDDDDHNCFSSYLDDCLPLTATDWFRSNWCQAFLLTVFATYIQFDVGIALAFIRVALNSSQTEVYRSFARQVRADECGFWFLNDDSEFNWVPIEFDKLEGERWTWLELLEALSSLTIWPTLILSMSIAHYFNAMSQFNLMIVDLKLQMVTLIELGELILHAQLATLLNTHRPTATICDQSGTRITPMRRIRNRLYDQIERVLAFWPERRHDQTKLEKLIERQAFALDLLLLESRARQPTNNKPDIVARELYLNLLERLHINYRLFMGTFREHHQPVTDCLLFGFALNYGFALIGLYWFMRIKSFVLLPVLLVCTSLALANGLIVFSSRVHADARKLEPHFMTLIRQLYQMDDNLRARHLRHLWLKQLYSIDASGGLALRLFGKINVTYVAIIRSVILSSSILMFTYTRVT